LGAWTEAIIFLGILVAVFFAYSPALRGGFIWDDHGHVTRADLRSLDGLGRIWFEIGATQQYYPLLHSAFWLEHRLWDDSPLGYHLFNVVLHAAAAFLFGRALTRLAVPGAWLAPLVFALHPVCVESVAWIAEQKNTLSAVFYLASALAYLRFAGVDRPLAEGPSSRPATKRYYALATFLFVCALLTKTVTATLPAALLVVFWWKRGRLELRRDVVPLLPWFVLGAVSGLFTAHFEHKLIGAQGEDFALDLVQRGLLAGRVFWFYLSKLVWPANLAFIYPRWTIDVSSIDLWLFLIAALALLGGLIWWRRRSRAPLAAALLFGGTLFPVLGFFNVFPFLFSYVADHFQYLASLPVFSLAAAGIWSLAGKFGTWTRYAASAALLLILGGLTHAQSEMYRDEPTLYETTIARNPNAWLAQHNLAILYANSGRFAEAMAMEERVLKLHPDYALAENSLGDDLIRLGRTAEAIPHLRRAVELQPNYAVAQCNLGLALAAEGHTEEAIPHFETALQFDPNYADAELNWGIGLMLTQRFSEAIPHFERAIDLNPGSADFRLTYGRALAHEGRLEAAIRRLNEALEIEPNLAEAHALLVPLLHQLGRDQEAMAHAHEADRLQGK
jgi:tetratricopeptide (TPR) repeat protein